MLFFAGEATADRGMRGLVHEDTHTAAAVGATGAVLEHLRFPPIRLATAS